MNMKDHILTALSEQFNEWEELLTGMSEEQLTIPQLPILLVLLMLYIYPAGSYQ